MRYRICVLQNLLAFISEKPERYRQHTLTELTETLTPIYCDYVVRHLRGPVQAYVIFQHAEVADSHVSGSQVDDTATLTETDAMDTTPG